MQKKLIRLSSLILILIMIFSLSSFAVAAEESTDVRSVAYRSYLSVTGVKSKTVSSYSSLNVYEGGVRADYSARLILDTVYIPLNRFIESIESVNSSYNAQTRTLSVKGAGHNISVSDGAFVLYASDRPIFSMTPSAVLSDGNMYVPLSTVEKAFSIKGSLSGKSLYLTGSPKALTSASRFYREDEVYWLARIINAESRGEPLLGQIAVGNVVLNRVRSSQYPNTIWSVIFDKKYGVQFSPILDGSIYNEPTYTAILAAKISLEGFTVSDEALFFLYPSASTSSWIPKNREYAFSIGNHDFYK